MIKHYPSIAALRQDYINLHEPKSDLDARKDFTQTSWYGGETETASLIYAAEGQTSLVPEAETLLTSLDTAIETPRRQWGRSPAGAYASVPDVLAGLPTPMRRQAVIADDRAPITILVCTTSSAGVSASTLRKRGVVILALAMALSRIRPLSLRPLCCVDGNTDGTGETIITAEINTTPLDLATACYVLTSAGFARRLTYGLAKKHNGFTGGWPKGYKFGGPGPWFSALVPRLGLEPKDTLVIGSAELGDRLLSEPLAWINDQIKRFTQAA